MPPRGHAGRWLLAHTLFAKSPELVVVLQQIEAALAHVAQAAQYGLHLTLNRQSATYAREGIELEV
jgi:hypothetical protein